MDLLDANVLIGAFRPDDPDHAVLKGWLEKTLSAGLAVTFPALVEVAFVRIVTHPKIFRVPSPLKEAVEFLHVIHESGVFQQTPWTSNARVQWQRWCGDLGLHGNDVNDVYLAALSADARCRLVTRDKGFSRFPGLDWWNPTAG